MALPIRARLTIWYCAVPGLTLLLTGALVMLKVQIDLRNGVDRALSLAASEITMGYRAPDSEDEFRDVTEASLGGLPEPGSRRSSSRRPVRS